MNTKIYKITDPADPAFEELGEIIRNGGLVSFPTETVYGLGANAYDSNAALKVFAAKSRPADNPLIVHINSIDDLPNVATDIPKEAIRLFSEFSPGPLTIILKKNPKIGDNITAGLNTVAVRIPKHSLARALINAAKVPIAAPSSNLSGRPSPTRAQHVINDMYGRIDAIIDGGNCSVGVESTVIELSKGTVNILRPGGITLSQLKQAAGNVLIDKHVTQMVADSETPKSPGMKYKHYAPDADVTVISGEKKAASEKIKELISKQKGIPTGVMCYDGFTFDCEAVLYMGTDNRVYAERLFDTLRHFDELKIQKVFAQFSDDPDFGLAVKNRLFKAAGGDIIQV